MIALGARSAVASLGALVLLLTACSDPEPQETEAPWPTPSPTAEAPDVDPLAALTTLAGELDPAPIGAAAINPWGVSVTHQEGAAWSVTTRFDDPAISQESHQQELVLRQATLEDLAMEDLQTNMDALGCPHHVMGTSAAMPGGALLQEFQCTDASGVASEHQQLLDGREVEPYTGGWTQDTIQRALDDAQRIQGETVESILFESSEQGQDIRAFSITEYDNPLHESGDHIGETCKLVADFGGDHRHPLDVSVHCNLWYAHYVGHDLYIGESTAGEIMQAIAAGAAELGVEVAEIRSVEVDPFEDTTYVNLRTTPLFQNDDIGSTQAFDNQEEQP